MTTALYMAPELIDDECVDQDDDSQDLFTACLTKASDVYAFGMVALEVSSGFVRSIAHEESMRPSLTLLADQLMFAPSSALDRSHSLGRLRTPNRLSSRFERSTTPP